MAVGKEQFDIMAGKWLRLKIFGILYIHASIEVYRLISATNAKQPTLNGQC